MMMMIMIIIMIKITILNNNNNIFLMTIVKIITSVFSVYKPKDSCPR